MFLIRNLINETRFDGFWTKHSYFKSRASSSKKIVLYGDEASPPVRFVMMTASILNVDYTFHRIDLFKAENKTDFYKQINPLQKVPTLSVDRSIICDSHAIALYLCRMKESRDLYPSEVLGKAAVDRMLFFNATNLFPVDSFLLSEYFAGIRPMNQEKVAEWYSYLKYLDDHLSKHRWLAGDQVRLCDICCGATITSLELLLPVVERYDAVKSWLERLRHLPCFEINNIGLKRLQTFIKLFQTV